eukprot:329940-Pleurochrysis_carterae.AAC.1
MRSREQLCDVLLAKASGCRLAYMARGQACVVQHSECDMPDRACVAQLVVGKVADCAPVWRRASLCSGRSAARAVGKRRFFALIYSSPLSPLSSFSSHSPPSA